MCVVQRDGLGVIEDASALSAGSEFEWGEQRRIQMVSVLRGFRGTGHTQTLMYIHINQSLLI